jgi:hypothetical protein
MYIGIPYMYITPFEILTYFSLKHAGWDVEYVIYDDSVLIHELTTSKYDEIARSAFISNNFKEGINILRSANVKYSFIEKLDQVQRKKIDNLSSLDEILNFEYQQHALGKIVERVLFRFYKSITIEDQPDVIEKGKLFLDTVLRNYLHSNTLLKTGDYDCAMFSHGIYCTWEPVVLMCRQHNVDYICYDRGKTKNTVNINKNQVAPDWSFDDAWNEHIDRTLTDFERNAVDEYLKSRELQQGDIFAYNFKQKEKDLSLLRQKLDIYSGQKVITFFTNLIWDAANVDRDEAFNNFVEAIEYTSKLFSNREDIKILVRTHPAEIVLGTNLKYESLIDSGCSNVFVIDEALQLNSFSILEISDISVTHTSTVGLEMAMTGKPSIILGKTHYKNKGFTFDPGSVDQYKDNLCQLINENTDSSVNKTRQEISYKYFYMMMFLYQQVLPVEYENNTFSKYSYSSFDELIAKDKSINLLLQVIENKDKSHFIAW